MINADPEFEMLCEIDKWRFVALVMLELQVKRPIPLDPEYLKRKGFDLKKRPMSLTIQMLHTLVEVCNETVTHIRVEKNRIEEKRIEKSKHRDFVFLTPDEHKKLLTTYGENNTDKLIADLNRYIGQSGKKYKSHYFTLLNFAERDDIPKLIAPKEDTAAEQRGLERKRQEIRDDLGNYYRERTIEELQAMLTEVKHLSRKWLIKEVIAEKAS